MYWKRKTRKAIVTAKKYPTFAVSKQKKYTTMKIMKNLVSTMFRNIFTAGTVAFAMMIGFAACSDELADDSSEPQGLPLVRCPR